MPEHKKPFFSARPVGSEDAYLKPDSKSKFINHEVPPEQANKHLQLFKWFGLDCGLSSTQITGDCPFCGKEAHFFASPRDGTWDCKVCLKKGNIWTFIRDIHAFWFALTTPSHFAKLRTLRKQTIDQDVMIDMQLAFNAKTQEWMIPAWTADGNLGNLYVWRESFDGETGKPSRQIMAAPQFSHIAYGVHKVRAATNRPLFVCEGHWDYLALQSLLNRLKLNNNYDLVAAPGAGTYPKRYLGIFGNRDVYLVFDNDEAGQKGMERLINSMASTGTIVQSLRVLDWPASLPVGFDISDACHKLPLELTKKKAKEPKQ